VDNDIDSSESVESGFEKLLDIGCVGDIRLYSNRGSAGRFDRCYNFFASRSVTSVSCRNREAVVG